MKVYLYAVFCIVLLILMWTLKNTKYSRCVLSGTIAHLYDNFKKKTVPAESRTHNVEYFGFEFQKKVILTELPVGVPVYPHTTDQPLGIYL